MQNDTAFWPRAFSLRCKTHEIALFADDTARPQKPKPVAIFYGLFSRCRCDFDVADREECFGANLQWTSSGENIAVTPNNYTHEMLRDLLLGFLLQE